MEKELRRQNKSITDSWTLDSEVFSKDTLLYSIVQTGGQFGVAYQDPLFFYDCCELFWSKYQRTFQKWFDAFEIEYNPLENYDRNEHTEFTPGITDTTEHTGTDTETPSGVTIESHLGKDTETPSGQTTMTDEYQKNQIETVETQVSGFDSSAYLPKEKVINTPSGVNGTSGKDTTTHTTSYNQAKTENDYNSRVETSYNQAKTEFEHGEVITNSKEGKDETDTHIHGNIGVTTSQQMLESELKVQAWNIYTHISDLFCSEMLITVY